MLDYNDVKPKKYIILDDGPYEVLASHVFRKQQRKPVNATKLRNMITGSVREHSFAVSDKVEEAGIEKKSTKYLFNKPTRQSGEEEFWFCDPKNPANRFQLPESIIGEQKKFLKQNSEVEVMYFGEQPIGLSLPIKMDLKVNEAAPAVRGNTIQGGVKQVVLETGATINTPMFVNEGDIIRINTETGEYVERVGKK